MLKNIVFGLVYFLIVGIILEQWNKRRKSKEENIKNLVALAEQTEMTKQLKIVPEIENKRKAWNAILKDFRQRLKVNKKPDSYQEHRDCKIKIYNLSGNNKIFKVVDWDNRTRTTKYFTLEDAKRAIQYMYASYSNKQAYLAEKERRIRKREQDVLLAKSYKQRQRRSKLKANLITIDRLMELTPIEFEQWVKQNVFEKDGWSVEETRVTGDGGIDLVLNRNDEHSIAQCKRFRNTVGEPALRDFYGTMMSEGVSRGYFVTTGLFSLSAQKFAQDKPIIMVDRRLLAQKLK